MEMEKDMENDMELEVTGTEASVEEQGSAEETETNSEETKEAPAEDKTAVFTAPADVNRFEDVYEDTLYFVDGMVEQYDFYPEIIDALGNGSAKIELKKRYMLKAIDEDWVSKIEDCIPALDEVIRTPSRFIEETEKVLPIELSRNISSRSVQHLSQHTDYISKVEDGVVTPSKILNVFRDETNKTYENKFINTLINRLFLFVERRYETALKEGKDEKNTSLDYSQKFTHGDIQGKIHFRMEISEDPKNNEELKNYTYTKDLWNRVVRLHHVCRAYINSSFVQSMDGQFVRPPVIRTNAILKNKNLRQCLELWEFIESYENIGYNMLIQEDLEAIDQRYIKEIYSVSALQYLIFRYNIKNEFETDKTLASGINTDLLTPEIENELKPLDASEFNKTYTKTLLVSDTDSKEEAKKASLRDRTIRRAVDVALISDAIMRDMNMAGDFPRRKYRPLWLKKLDKAVDTVQGAVETAATATAKGVKTAAIATANGVKTAATATANGVKTAAKGAKRGFDASVRKADDFCRSHTKELEAVADVAADIALKAALVGTVMICNEKGRKK